MAAFFFFSWILQLLWNSILFEQLQLVPTQVSYWQAAGLWFFVIILFAWTGFGVRPRRWIRSRRRSDCDRFGERIERKIKARVSDWASVPDDELEQRERCRV